MDRNEALFDRAREVIPGGVNSPVRAFRSVGGAPRFIHWKDTCAYELLGGYKVFVAEATACKYKQQDGAAGVCYHIPVDSRNIFTS